MQFQTNANGFNYQSRFGASPINNQRSYNYSPLPPQAVANQTSYIRGGSRVMSPQYNPGSIPQILTGGNKPNNKLDINLNINVNNDGTISPTTNNNFTNANFGAPQYMNANSGLYIGQQMRMPVMNPQFINPVGQFGRPPLSPNYGYPPPPAFIGTRMNISPPQPFNPIKPPTNQIKQPINFKIQQDQVHCVICQTDYPVSDRQQHIKRHLRSKQNQQNNKIRKLVHDYKKQHEQPKTRPIVEPQQYNIQYNPNSFVLQKQTSFSTPTFNKPMHNDFSGGTSDFNVNTNNNSLLRSNLPSVINEPIRQSTFTNNNLIQPLSQPQNVRLTAEGQRISNIDPKNYQTNRLIDSNTFVQPTINNNPINNNQISGRFDRDTFISDQQSIIKPSPILPNRQTIQSQTFKLGSNAPIPNNLTTATPPPTIQKIELGSDQFSNLDKLDSTPYRNSATYQRKYIPPPTTTMNQQRVSTFNNNQIPIVPVPLTNSQLPTTNNNYLNNQIDNSLNLSNSNIQSQKLGQYNNINDQSRQPLSLSNSFNQPLQSQNNSILNNNNNNQVYQTQYQTQQPLINQRQLSSQSPSNITNNNQQILQDSQRLSSVNNTNTFNQQNTNTNLNTNNNQNLSSGYTSNNYQISANPQQQSTYTNNNYNQQPVNTNYSQPAQLQTSRTLSANNQYNNQPSSVTNQQSQYSTNNNPVRQTQQQQIPMQDIIQQKIPNQSYSNLSNQTNQQPLPTTQQYPTSNSITNTNQNNLLQGEQSMTQTYQDPQAQTTNQLLQILHQNTSQDANIKRKKLPKSIGGWDV